MTQTSSPNPNCNNCANSLKFLYSYNGQILPRRSDGVLRYVGGHTRILSVSRSISFAELLVKFGELTRTSMKLKCKLPSEDLDVLVSIKSDDELKNMIHEYDRVSEVTHQEMKIRAVLFPVQSLKKVSQPSSPISCLEFHNPPRPQSARTAPASYFPSPPSSPVTQSRFQPTRMAAGSYTQYPPCAVAYRSRSPPAAVGYPAAVGKGIPTAVGKGIGRSRCCPHGSLRQQYFVPCLNNFCL